MAEPLIPGGYILLSRKLIESEIFKKPPLYLKVWIYLLSKAQHQSYKKLERGQLFTSIPEIQEACSWYVGYRKETPSKEQIYRIIDWLRKSHECNCERSTSETMITTTKATQGILIYIENFNIYQDSKNYERNNEHDSENKANELRSPRDNDNINKNVDNDKNEKEDIVILSEDENKFITILSKIENYPLDRKKDLEMYHSLGARYPELDLLEAIEDFRQYKMDKPLQKKSNSRSQINTSFKNYVKWGKCLKKNKPVTQAETREENPFLNRG